MQDMNALHDREAEQMVLGSLMTDASVVPVVVQKLGTTSAAFFTLDHQILYTAILTTYDRTGQADPLLVADQLKKDDTLNRAGGAGYLYELQAPIVETQSTEWYADILREKSVRRQLVDASAQIRSAAADENIPTQEALNTSQELLFKIAASDTHRGLVHIRPSLMENIEIMEALHNNEGERPGLSTGFSDFDLITSGLQPGQLIILAARPGKGKTTFALNMATHIAQQKDVKPVVFFSLEMPIKDITLRMLSAESQIHFTKVRNGALLEDEWPEVMAASARLAEAPIFLNDDMNVNVLDIRAYARRLSDEHGGLSVIFVDYLQLMSGSESRYKLREQEIAEISRNLKALAAELNVPVIACSQLNRESEKRPGKEPQLSDLRESGAIEQDADLVAFLHDDHDVEDIMIDEKKEVELIIKKHRNGMCTRMFFYFHQNQFRFENPK